MERKLPWRTKSFAILFLVCCGVFFVMMEILQLDSYLNPPQYLANVYIPDLDDIMRGFVVKTQGCNIPDMEAFDESVVEFIKPRPSVTCEYDKPPLYDSNETAIFRIRDAVVAYIGNDSDTEIVCCYRPFFRLAQSNDNTGEGNAKYNSCIPVEESSVIVNEFVEVECRANETIVYLDFFSFVPPKQPKKVKWKQKPLNVIILGIDALSRLNFIRQMGKTYNYLKSSGFIEFKGFNKVGDNTYPNLVPVLSGHTDEELGKLCSDGKKYYDNCPFIWKNYSSKGFLTGYAEDCAWMSTFYYQKQGFSKAPTDYFWTFFNKVSMKKIGNTHMMNVNYCVGNRYQYETHREYIGKFVANMNKYQKPYFGFFWSNSMSHDDLNQPKLADGSYEELLKSLDEKNLLNNTAVVVLSDHGIRWGNILATYQGKLENRLPVLMVRLPQWYQKTHANLVENLVFNSRQLVTPFDVHETLKDLLDPYNINSTTPISSTQRRGYSLFTKVPENRTCDSAGISVHWCTCQTSEPVPTTDPMVLNITAFVVDYINYKLENFTLCANLSIDKIFTARLLKHSNELSSGDVVEDYTVQFRTYPGGGQFEATVRHVVSQRGGEIFEVMGTIGRTNLYGEQSHCISDYRMKLYCYCNQF